MIRRTRSCAVPAALAAAALVVATLAIEVSSAAFVASTPSSGSFAAVAMPPQTGLLWWLDSSDAGTLFQNSDCTSPATTAAHRVKCWHDRRDSYSQITGNVGAQIQGTAINSRQVLQFEAGELLTGPNRFSGSTTSDMHIVVVARENTRSASFPLSLNGTATGSLDRFSLHVPWSDGRVIFDAGGCCLINRVATANNTVTTGTPFLVAASKHAGTLKNAVRFNHASEVTSLLMTAAPVGGGLAVGDINSLSNHSFAEILVYDHRLSSAELTAVDAYVLAKWGL